MVTKLAEPTDQNLISRAQAGDREAFGLLVKRYAGRAIGSASAILGDRDEALDASQDAFIRAWRYISRYNGQAKFYTWYSTILRNLCITRLRKRKRRKTYALTDEHPVSQSARCDPAALAQRNERAELLWKGVHELSESHREIIVMSHFMHMTYKQIAAELGIPIGTVMSRLHQARGALRKLLAGGRL